jgi:hypothetical protein
MDDNLLERGKRALGGEFPRLAAEMLGVSEGGVRSAIDTLLPAVVGVVAQRGRTAGGADALLKQLHEAPIDAGMRGDLGSLFAGTGAEAMRLMRTGTDLVGGLFGDRGAALVDKAARAGGLTAGPASDLLALLVPIVMGLLKKLVRERRLDAGGLAAMLGGQPANVRRIFDPRIVQADEEASAPGVVALAEGRGASKVLPWVLAVIGIVILFLLVRTCTTPGEKETVTLPGDKTGPIASRPPSAASR